ncbi:MAG: aminotransferase class I/II-fold pyridoxal phosphate-dependent enzyme [Verrucomicrobiota bacterium]|nr:aminotransferase class I/II-fold pyridoxal phosphate-dependent enzyme [Verrucomicrobiota bacterium]
MIRIRLKQPMIPYSKQAITEEDEIAVNNAIVSPLITQGPKVVEFEKAICEMHGCGDAVACSSGSSALILAYAGCGINESSIGIVPSITFASTANALRHLGAKVVFCDVDHESGLIDLQSLEESLQSVRKTTNFKNGVITPVSLAGRVAPLKEIRKLADQFEMMVVEDASHSPLAWSDEDGVNVRSCSCEWTEFATLSFHPVKHVCCGEGGAVLAKNKDLASLPRRLSTHGIEKNTDPNRPWMYEQLDLGWNFRLTEIQASLGISQLSRLKSGIIERKKLAANYHRALSDYPFKDFIGLPDIGDGHSLHLYVVRFIEPLMRDKAYHFLKSKGIASQVHYIPVYKHPYYKNQYGEIEMEGAEKYFESCLSLPLYPGLAEADQSKVIHALSSFLEE